MADEKKECTNTDLEILQGTVTEICDWMRERGIKFSFVYSYPLEGDQNNSVSFASGNLYELESMHACCIEGALALLNE